MTASASHAQLLERFFTQRLMQQLQASPHTISSYRDTFRQFLKFAQQRLHKSPSQLNLEHVDAPLVVEFLDELGKHHGLSVRSRNLRLTPIRSFFHYVAFEAPDHSAQIQRVLAIPSKRFTRTLIHFLTRPEVDALLAAPDQRTWFGRRDHAISQRKGRASQRSRGAIHVKQAQGSGCENLSFLEKQAGYCSLPEPHHGDGPSTGRSGPISHCLMART